MRIRPAQPADLEALVSLAQQCFGPSAWTRAQFEAIPLLLTADDDDERRPCIGFLALQLAADEGELQALAVQPEYRRHGVGAALLAEGMRQAAARGTKTIFLEVRAGNQAAQAFYRTSGFAPCGLRPRYYRDPDEAAVLMRLSL